ncbi:MAG: dipeptidase [Caldilineales bacterium]
MLSSDSLHFDAIVIDGHCDTVGDVLAGKRTFATRSTLGHADLPRLAAGGITAQIFACFVPVHEYHRGATAHALRQVETLLQAVDTHPDQLLLARRAADIRRAKAEGKIAAILGLEGAEPLGDSLELLHIFQRLGVRVLGLTWNFRNTVADGVMEGGQAGGLSAFGREVVAACNRLGIVLDVAHLAPAGVADVLALSSQPVIASHSNAAALFNHYRNLSNEQIASIAAGGGLIGVTFVNAFLHAPPNQATLAHVLDQIDYLVRVAGPQHVMLGSDFDGAVMPRGLEDATRYPALTAGMLARGHSETVVRQVLGLNFLRVFEAVCGA